MLRKVIVVITVLVSTLACNLPLNPQFYQVETITPISLMMVTADPDATKTPTPFQPAPPTQLAPVNITPAKPSGLTPSATAKNIQATKTPNTSSSKYPAGQVRIMVLGSDSRGEAVARTDIIMMVSINPSTGNVSVLSFPRDLWVNLPGVGMNRINTAMVYGGFNLLAATLETNFGIKPNHYILTTFKGFTSIIDSVGGIDVNAAVALTDLCALPQAVRNYCTIKKGVTHMNGATALWYVRSRYSTSDFDRERRSQEVMQALFNKMMKLNSVAKLPEFYEIYKKNVQTSLTLKDIVGLAGIAPGLVTNTAKIRRYSITSKDVYNYVVPGSGAQVLIPNMTNINQIINQAVFTP